MRKIRPLVRRVGLVRLTGMRKTFKGRTGYRIVRHLRSRRVGFRFSREGPSGGTIWYGFGLEGKRNVKEP